MNNARALANQEREAQVRRLNRASYRLLMLVATVLSFATVTLLAVDQLYRPQAFAIDQLKICLLYTSPSPRDGLLSRMPSSA